MQQFSFVSLGLLVVALSFTGAAADSHCPSDWKSDNDNGPCYKLFKLLRSWNDAEVFCRKQGSHLASIQSSEETRFVAKLVKPYVFFLNVWIGLSDPWKQRAWVWSDGSSFGYTSWESGEPNNALRKEYCVSLRRWSKFSTWMDEHCGFLHFFVCKFQPQGEGSTW